MALHLEKRPHRTPARPGIFVDTEEEPGAWIPAMREHFPGNDPGVKRARRALHASKGD